MAIAPESQFGQTVGQGINPDVDLVTGFNVIDLQAQTIKGDFPVRINCSVEPQTEYVFG